MNLHMSQDTKKEVHIKLTGDATSSKPSTHQKLVVNIQMTLTRPVDKSLYVAASMETYSEVVARLQDILGPFEDFSIDTELK
jgi:hypothetical protein